MSQSSRRRRELATSRFRRFTRAAFLIVLPYLLMVLMLGLLQRSLIYFPLREASVPVEAAGLPPGQVLPITVTTSDGLKLHGWHVLPDGQCASNAQEADGLLQAGPSVALFFCGNGAHRGYRGPEFSVLTDLGMHVFIVDYRGYAENEGAPSEHGLARDARAVWDYATQERRIAPARILLYGESLGGAVATRLAAEQCENGTPPAGLILRSTFPSLAEIGAYHYPWLPVRWLLLDRYPSQKFLARVTCPLLQMHGTDDTIVPLEFGRQLFAAAPEHSAGGVPKQFVELQGANHNDVHLRARPQVEKAVADFLQAVPVPSDR